MCCHALFQKDIFYPFLVIIIVAAKKLLIRFHARNLVADLSKNISLPIQLAKVCPPDPKLAMLLCGPCSRRGQGTLVPS